MSDLPNGTVTFLFTDIEDSTRLWQEHPHAMQTALARHNAILQQAIRAQNGHIFQIIGDAFCAAFSQATDALTAALEVQRSLHNESWDETGPLRVRIGLHSGFVETLRGEYLSSLTLVRVQRVMSAGHGGQTLLSPTTAELVRHQLPTDTLLRDLGKQRLRGLTQPEHIFQVIVTDLPTQFPPLRVVESKVITGDNLVPKQNQLVELEKRKDKSSEKSIAVLPFENMSGDPDQSFFSDGITEDIITDLSKVSSIFVVARNSSFTYKGRSVKTQEVCADLGVRYVVEGSVRKSGNRVRISAQLIDGSTDGHIWADRYDGTLEDIFELQDEVTCQIVDALKIRLLPEEKKAIQKVPTSNIKAYEFYLRGREYFHYYTKDNYHKAQDYFNRAIAYDESYAQPYCGLADCGSFLNTLYGGDYPLTDALAAAAKAIALAPALAEGHASLGLVLSSTGDHSGAEKEFQTAVRLDPNLYEAHYYWARSCFTQGKLEEAAVHFEDAWERSPKDPQTPSLLLQIYRSLGRQADLEYAAQETVKSGLQKLEEEPDNWRTCLSLAFGLLNLNQFSETIKYLDRALENNADDALVNYNVACLYSGMGEIDKAIHHLEISLRLGSNTIGWIKNDSDLDPVRDHPHFLELIEKYL